MPPDLDSRTFLNDVFISYSRKDREFAALLQEALRKYKPPKGLNLAQRNLKEAFYDAWYKLLADLYDISRNEIEERD
jgi:hypothetical protein